MTAASDPYLDSQRPLDDRLADLLARMTLGEKAGQLTQGPITTPEEIEELTGAARRGDVGSLILGTWPDTSGRVANSLQRAAVMESRLHIPLLFGYDAIHGYRTTFPIPLALGCTWDPALVEAAQAVSAREARPAGVSWIFTPMSDIALDPRWGRVAESFGEDPYLVGQFVAASVRGLQGADPSAFDRTAATLKHFVGYGASVGGRDYNHAEIPAWQLRNLHLPPFEAGVRAGAVSVMSAFHLNDGIPAVANRALLTGVLREEWGFRGPVVSDYDSVNETIVWGHAADGAEAAGNALTAGNDIDMISGHYRRNIPALVASGRLPLAVVDEAVRRVLRLKFQLGLFEQPYAPETVPAGTFLRPDALALARRAVARSAVLLRNDGVLPLAPGAATRIALLGPLGDDAGEMLGTWPGFGLPADVVTLAAGLRTALPAGSQLEVVSGCELMETGPRTITRNDGTIVVDEAAKAAAQTNITGAVEAARRAEVSILAVGEPRGWSGESASRATLSLTGRQEELVRAVAALGRPLVLVVFSGRPLVLPELNRTGMAVLQAWHPGIQAGPGLTDLLLGTVAPSGKLTVSWPRSVGQVPVYYNRYQTGRPTQGGYRDSDWRPLYPFGHGLTYTTFAYSAAKLRPGQPGEHARLCAAVTNSGPRSADEIVQLYVQDVACVDGARPVQELRGWLRVTLAPGESREVEFAITDAVLGHVDRQGRHKADPGLYRLWIAPHAGTGTPVEFQFTKAQV
ncbi:MAG: glycoside hydrolase family 3 N-terminal domain-containing protein [Opitutales bacterium]